MTAIHRGIRFEICYAQGIREASGEKRRTFIGNAMAIVRATRGRGLIVSSEARTVLSVRSPADVGNLLNIWGVDNERAKEAITTTPRIVVANEAIKRRGYRGIIDVVEGGEREHDKTGTSAKPEAEKFKGKDGGKGLASGKNEKRTMQDREDEETGPAPPMSKRQEKRMRQAARKSKKQESHPTTPEGALPVPVSESRDIQMAESNG